MQNLSFDVYGMTCGGCTGGVQRALVKLDGVSYIEVSPSPDVVTVLAEPARVATAQIESAIGQLGYPAKARPKAHGEQARSQGNVALPLSLIHRGRRAGLVRTWGCS